MAPEKLRLTRKRIPHIDADPVLKAQFDRKIQPEAEPRSRPPKIKPSWYKNPKLSDITIVYGEYGEKRFQGHRFVLCNSSEWFVNASSHWIFEAQDRTITLKEDYPDALEALFEFCYKGRYTATKEGENLLDWTKNLFMQHARVFIVADKYMADDLADMALDRFEARIRCEAENNERAFFKFAVEQLYVHDDLFGYDPQHAEVNARYRREVADEDELVSDQEACKDGNDEDGDVEMQDEDFNTKELDDMRDEMPSRHPLDRLRAIVLDAALGVSNRDHADLGQVHLAVLAKKIPGFGADFAIALMRGW